MRTARFFLITAMVLICLTAILQASEPLFYVSTAEGDTIFAVYPSGIKVRNATGEDIFIADRDSVRIYVDEDAMRTSRGSFAIGGIGSATREPATEYFRVTPDSVRVYLKENDQRTSRGGFAIGGTASATRPGGSHFFNLENSHEPEIIDPSEARMLWYPYKEAFRVGHVVIESPDSVGTNSLATGYESKAIGDYSQALGYQARAVSDYSTAIGLHAQARGESSFAYGDLAEANGAGSFAFGSVARDTLGNIVYGASAAKADGAYSFAMGMGANTGGICSMAIGFNASAQSSNTLALGRNSSASGSNAVAMGYSAHADEYNSLAIGFYANATGRYSTALGYYPSAIGDYSFAVGRNNTATGEYATSIGCYNEAVGDYSVALGRQSETGDYGTASGSHCEATGEYSVAMGRQSISSGIYTTTFGGYSESSGDYATAIGRQSFARGDFSIALGSFHDVDSMYSVAIGYSCQTHDRYAIAIGDYAIANGQHSVSLGNSNTANGDYSFATGSYSQANDYYAFAAGTNCTADGNSSIAMGSNCEAKDAWTIAMGYHAEADGQCSIALGDNAVASSINHSVAIGEDVTANGMNSMALGKRASTGGYYGCFVYGDYSNADSVKCDDFNQFKVRASGGYIFHTNSTMAPENTVYIYENDGSMGLGKQNPEHKLCLLDTIDNTTGTDGTFIDIENTSDNTGAMTGIRFKNGSQTDVFKGGIFFNDSNSWGRGDIVFATSNTYDAIDVDRDDARMVVYSNGNVGIGTPASANPGAKLSVDGDVKPYTDAARDLGSLSNRWRYVFASVGTIQTSDERQKENIRPIRYGLQEVMKLRPVRFQWKDNEDRSENLGLIAQETQKVIPEVVMVGEDEDKTLGMNYTELIPVLISAIQEQQKQIEQTKQEVEQLKQQLAKEKNRNSQHVASSE